MPQNLRITTLARALKYAASFEGTGVVFVNYAGDTNGDKVVNIFDILAVKSRWETKPDTSNWLPEYDVNSDEAINIFDILTVKSNWGQTTP